MMNDVAEQKQSLQENSTTPSDDFSLEIRPEILARLKEYVIHKHGNTQYLNGIINNIVLDFFSILDQQHDSSLYFDGRPNIRSDVLKKLKSISEYLETLLSFPNMNYKSVESGIDHILGVEKRTNKKYLDCIVGFSTLHNNTKPPVIDLSGLKDAILLKIHES